MRARNWQPLAVAIKTNRMLSFAVMEWIAKTQRPPAMAQSRTMRNAPLRLFFSRPTFWVCLISFAALLFSTLGSAQSSSIESFDRHNRIAGIYLLNKTLQLDNVELVSAQPDGAFSKLSEGLSAGYGLKPHWLKIRLQRTAQEPSVFWLELSPSYLDNIDFFSPAATLIDGKHFSQVSTGDLHPFSTRMLAHRNFVFRVELPDTQPRDFYVRIQTRSSAVAQFSLWTHEELDQHAHGDYFWQGILLGTLILILHLALTHWHMLRQRFALLLFGQALATLIAYSGINGTAAEFLTPERPLLNDLITSIGSSFMVAFAVWFFLDFFRLSELSRWAGRFFQVTIIVCLLSALSAPTEFYSVIAPIMYFLVLWVLLVILFISYRTPDEEVVGRRWVFYGFFLYSLSPCLNMLLLLGVLPPYGALPYLSQFFAVMQLGFLQQAVQARVRENENQRKIAEMRAYEAETRTSIMAAKRMEQAKFLSLIAHEIKTPLTVIDSAIQAIQYAQKNHASFNVEERHQRIRDAVFRLNTLLESALSEERAANQSLQPRSEKTLTAALIAEINAMSIASISVISPYPAECHADQTLLRIALGNLIDNARKYAIPNTPIELSISRHAHKNREGVQFSVSNLCSGTAPGDTQRWFSKYFRANNETEGIGLGLYLIRQIAEAHGGYSHISTIPEVDNASYKITVSIWLPDPSTIRGNT